MTEINKIGAGAIYTQQQQKNNETQTAAPEVKQEAPKPQQSALDPKEVLDALAMAGNMNMASVKKAVDPAKYLSPERIADIQKSMGVFEARVDANKAAIAENFPGMSEKTAQKLALLSV